MSNRSEDRALEYELYKAKVANLEHLLDLRRAYDDGFHKSKLWPVLDVPARSTFRPKARVIGSMVGSPSALCVGE